jgi:hypothetical protein
MLAQKEPDVVQAFHCAAGDKHSIYGEADRTKKPLNGRPTIVPMSQAPDWVHRCVNGAGVRSGEVELAGRFEDTPDL